MAETDARRELCVWRHPKPIGAAGRCIGQTDLPVDPRRAKRLAHRIRQHARRVGLPHAIATSPLRRGADVGRWLRRWGWRHVVDARLIELDFGAWDGQPWSAIAHAEVAAWEADFQHHAPGGGESLQRLQGRVRDWLAGVAAGEGPRLVVGHAGWMSAWALLDAPALTPSAWPPSPRYGQLHRRAVTMRPAFAHSAF
ncbi:histidine phosphatase family protein [Sphaerotilus sp.]|uniref:histidine phosphatase family protein n=1 Tax=Sphaerotilus sp. TaxID=2093942 RepID=UPI002ACEE3BC|nr:histidine phosphatase family protein [Sphaerotilus sp.]MDZ7856231.1 histidine phosphatase family protein [Sphaerotilus sp.]